MSTVATEMSVSARVAQRLARSAGGQRYSLWLDRSVRFQYQDEQQCLQVTVPNRFVADWVNRNFKDDLLVAAQQELGEQVGLEMRIDAGQFPGASAAGPGQDAASAAPHHASNAKAVEQPRPIQQRHNRALRHDLKDFVVGPSNQLAFSAATRIVEDHDTQINPLFIHGGCGVGKTHLLQGLCRELLRREPSARVLYTTGEQFTNEFLGAMRANKLDQFRKKIRRLDLLAVDDVHFLANKQATQQEFLHSFDAIEMGGARVVLASDSHPTLIQQFSEALVSRCVRGMVVQVHPPDADTRVRIISVLAKRRGLQLVGQAVDKLAKRCVGSVREIEGTLTKLHALAALAVSRRASAAPYPAASSGAPLTVMPALIDQWFESEADHYSVKPVRFDTILNTVVGNLGLERPLVVGPSRHPHAVLARSLVIYLARQFTSMSYPEIAAAMQRRAHSTIITAAKRVESQLKSDAVVTMPGTLERLSLVEVIERLKRAVQRA